MDSLPTRKHFSSGSASSALLVYTDGSCVQGQDGTHKAGYGIFAKSAVHNVQISEPLHGEQTSQHAEVKALLSGLELVWALRPRRAVICTDSQYAASGCNKLLSSWRSNDYRKSDGNEIAYKSIWKRVDDYLTDEGSFFKRGMRVSVQWMPRNSSSEQKRSDYLAKLGCTLHKQCGLCGQFGDAKKEVATHRCMPICSKRKCKGSRRRFQSLEAYGQHVEACHTIRVGCRVPGCDVVFGSEKARDSHEEETHGKVMYECECCKATFEDGDDMDYHKMHCDYVPFCQLCERGFKNYHAMEQHDMAVHNIHGR